MMTPATRPEETTLLETFKAQSCTRSFGRLYHLFYSSVFDYIYTIVKDKDLAADLSQETFITAYEKLHLLRDNSMLRVWIFQVAKNKAMRHFRDDSRKRKMEDEVLHFFTSEGDMESESKEEVFNRISEIVEGFTHEEKNLIISKYYHHKSIKEIEEETGYGSSAVKMKIHRLRLKIKRQIPFSMIA